jgi:hypothetical protein
VVVGWHGGSRGTPVEAGGCVDTTGWGNGDADHRLVLRTVAIRD